MDDEKVKSMIDAAQLANRQIANFVKEETAENGRETAFGKDADRLAFEIGDIMTNMIPVEYEEIKPPGRSKQMTHMQARSVAGTVAMMLMFGLMGCIAMLLHEREGDTLQRLLTAAMPRSGVFWGKSLLR